MTPSRQPLLISPVVCPLHPTNIQHLTSNIRRPRRLHYEVLSISLLVLNGFSPTLVMGTNKMALIMERREAVAGTDLLDIVVPYTTPQLTRLALKKAEELASEIPSRIRILRMQRVPFPLDLRHPQVSLSILREQTRQVARGIRTEEIMIYLTRDAEDTLLKALRPDSVLVIASRKRWWRTAEESLKRLCTRHGHQVAMVYNR